MKMPKDPQDCTANILDPQRLLAWGDTQLKKIEKERKRKKPISGDKNFSELTNKSTHIELVKVSCVEREQKKVFQETAGDKQKELYAQRMKSKSVNVDNDYDNRLEMKENEDVINTRKKKKKKKKKKDKCETVSINIELKKGNVSYGTTCSNSKKKDKRRNNEDDYGEVKKIKKKKKKKDKNCISESNKNLSNKDSYQMCIKLTNFDNSDTATKENVNEDLKPKKKNKKKSGRSNDAENQEEITEMGDNELSPPKKKKSKKDAHKNSEASYVESNSEISDPNASTSKKKTKKKKMKDSYCTDCVENTIISDVNKVENAVNTNEDISVYTKKKSKKRMSSENVEADSLRMHKKQKKKNKEKTDNSELKKSSAVSYTSETDQDVSSCVQSRKVKKKKYADDMEDIASEIYVKRKKKKKKKEEENLENLDNFSVFSVSAVSTHSYKTTSTSKAGMKFGKSPISRLLSNQELCSLCCGNNTKCSKRSCNNDSRNLNAAETNVSASIQEESNCTQAVGILNSAVIVKQEKIDMGYQNCWPTNIKIKQEKIDEPQFDNPPNIFKETTPSYQNIQVNQEVCDMPTERSSNHEKKNENISKTDVINHSNGTDETENVEHNINNILAPSNSCNAENSNISFETYYNFYDDKLTIHEDISNYNELHNQNYLSEIKVGKGNVVMNKEILQEKTPHEVNCEASSSHSNQNAISTSSIVNSEEVSKEKMCHKYGIGKIENDHVRHNAATSSKNGNEIRNLEYIPLTNMEKYNQSDSNIIRTVRQNYNEIHLTVHQHLNQFQSNEYNLIPTETECLGQNHFQSDQYHQNPIENESHQQLNQFQPNQHNVILTENESHQQLNQFQPNQHNVIPTKDESHQQLNQFQPNQHNVIPTENESHQQLNQFQPNQHYVIPTENESHQQLNHFQPNQHNVIPTENESHQQLNHFQPNQHYVIPTENEYHQQLGHFQPDQLNVIPTENECHNQQTKHGKHKTPSERYQENHRSRYFDQQQSDSIQKSLIFCCVNPKLKTELEASRILKVHNSQIKFYYYRMSKRYYQDIHVEFHQKKHFENVVRHFANRIRCKSWYIKEDNKKRKKEDGQMKK